MNKDRAENLEKIGEEAWALINGKKYGSALSYCEEAESKGLETGGIFAAHSVALVQLKGWSQAATLINEKLKEYPEEPNLYYAKALLNVRRRKNKTALIICDYAASMGVWNHNLAETKSRCLIRLSRYQEAVSFIKQELDKYPNNSILHWNLWNAYSALGKRQQSRQEYETAIALDPSLVERLKKKRRRLMWSFAALAVYLIIGILLLPGSRYFMIPLWLSYAVVGVWSFPRWLKARRFEMAFLILILMLIAGFLAYYLTFNPSSFSLHTNRIAIIVSFLVSFSLLLLIWLVIRRHHSKKQSINI